MSNFILVNEPVLNGNEEKYLSDCIKSGWISSEGPFVKTFEQNLATRLDRKFGVAVTNGTAAIDLAIEALGIGKGDEVILPTFTIISCVMQIVRSGATPIFVDSDYHTWNMDVNQVISKITSRTKAILVVHIYGLPVDLNPILSICKEKSIYLIEDAAEVIGQNYLGKPCGSFGDISTVSFYPNKHITTGEGGMIFTNNPDLADNLKELRNLCFQPERRFVHERIGWNVRMTNLQAALGLAQLERLDEFVNKKRWIGKFYNELLSNLKGVQLPLKSTVYAENIYWVYGLVLDKELGTAEQIMKKLERLGVGTRPFFYPLHLQPVFKKENFINNEVFPVAENLGHQGFYIPSGLGLTEKDILKVSDVLYSVLN